MPNRLSKFTSSLKQLGEIQVTEWDFRSALPGEHQPASSAAEENLLSAEEMQALMVRLKNFLQ